MLPEVRTYQPGSAIRRGADWTRLFDDMLGRDLNGWTAWTPAADLYETEDSFVLELGLPGYTGDDIQVTVERGILTVTGQRSRREGDERVTYHLREHTYDRFTRSFSLPASVRADEVRAEFEQGMLVVTLPKTAEAKPRKVEVSVK